MGLSTADIPIPNLDQLGVFYWRIGTFMHIQKKAMDSDGSETQWSELEKLVKEVQIVMHDLVHPQKARWTLTIEGLELFADFKARTKTPEQIEATIRSDSK